MTLSELAKEFKLNKKLVQAGKFSTHTYEDSAINLCFLTLGTNIKNPDDKDAESQDRLIMSKGLAEDYLNKGLDALKDCEVLYSDDIHRYGIRRNSQGTILDKDCSSLF